jgi:hypothetical protein
MFGWMFHPKRLFRKRVFEKAKPIVLNEKLELK